MNLTAFFPLLIATHVVLAISLFLPALLLPFTLRTRTRDGEPVQPEPGRFVRGLLWLESNGTLAIGAAVAVTGIALLASLGWAFVSQPWLLVAIGIYAAVLLAAVFVQRPGVRRLLRLPVASDAAAQERWRAGARKQRYVTLPDGRRGGSHRLADDGQARAVTSTAARARRHRYHHRYARPQRS